MPPLEPPRYGTTDAALALLCALLLAVAIACLLASCTATVRVRPLPPPLTGDLRCGDPFAQCFTTSGVCRERRRGHCEGPNGGGP